MIIFFFIGHVHHPDDNATNSYLDGVIYLHTIDLKIFKSADMIIIETLMNTLAVDKTLSLTGEENESVKSLSILISCLHHLTFLF